MEPPSCCYHHTGGTGFCSQLKSWITAGCQMIPSCSGWGSHPTWNDSHIHSKHIKGRYWQILYAVDGDMEPPPCCYHHTCGTGFGKLAEKSWITAGCQKIIQSESALICPAQISLKGINTPYMSNMDVRHTQRLSAASTMTTWHHLLSTVTLNFQNCRGQTLPQWQRECIALHFASFNEESVSLLSMFSQSLWLSHMEEWGVVVMLDTCSKWIM